MSGDVLIGARKRLQELAGCDLSAEALEIEVSRLASTLFEAARQAATGPERARERRLAGMLDDANGQLLSILLTDRAARDHSYRHSVDQLRYLRDRLGLPRFVSRLERAQMSLGCAVGPLVPRLAGRLIARQIRSEVKGLVFPFEPDALERYLMRRRREGVDVNLNTLGEEVLGERSAQQRLAHYVELIARPEVSTLSVKLSSIFSQLDLVPWDCTVATLCDRLRPIYRAALAAEGADQAGGHHRKLVYLDMEAYADLKLTLAVVRRLLDEPEFLRLSAGLVLQAYVPESAALQRELAQWAVERCCRGGAPIRLRVVKGANLAAERVVAAHQGWTLPIFDGKHGVDANYARMLDYGTRPEVAAAVRLGIASHNVFDLALGLVLRAARGVEQNVGFEVLEGMANPMQRCLGALGAPVLVYAPVVPPDEMQSAVAYLVRRLDENTAKENFLRHAFSMTVDDDQYRQQLGRFKRAFRQRDTVSDQPRRAQNRFLVAETPAAGAPFENEPNTDFSSSTNRDVVVAALAEMASRSVFEITSRVDGQWRRSSSVANGEDPSRPLVTPYKVHLASADDVLRAVRAARGALPAWRAVDLELRRQQVQQVARVLRRRRAELIAAILLDAGKRVVEADAEVSEAIDFAEYYSRCATPERGVLLEPLGVVTVASPWNFPLAIPLSGIVAALLAGNTVIFKPALETPFVGERLASCLWEAGITPQALQLVLCADEQGSALIRDPDVAAVVLTGATSTAQLFLDMRPDLKLFAETGGKNALIVSKMADRDRAVADLVASAFGHAGQKCSAASLAIVEAEVYDDPAFKQLLSDAAASLAVGSAWELSSRVTPLIRAPGPDLLRGLGQLERGESWLLPPRSDPDNPRLWSPGIRWDVAPGSFTHCTELFGPLLSVLRADDLEHALALLNQSSYGLVAGLHSLDEREQARFVERADCGNLYVNRPITGALVGRQPFGGRKASSVGPGAKAGGPNYVTQLTIRRDLPGSALVAGTASRSFGKRLAPLVRLGRKVLNPESLGRLMCGVASFEACYRAQFRTVDDSFSLLGQDNLFRYQPCSPAAVRIEVGTDTTDLLLLCAAALLSGVELRLSVASEMTFAHGMSPADLGESLGLCATVESQAQLAAWIVQSRCERLRWLGAPASPSLTREVTSAGCHVAACAVVSQGRTELLLLHREQSISWDYHRHGHLGWRSPGVSPLP